MLFRSVSVTQQTGIILQSSESDVLGHHIPIRKAQRPRKEHRQNPEHNQRDHGRQDEQKPLQIFFPGIMDLYLFLLSLQSKHPPFLTDALSYERHRLSFDVSIIASFFGNLHISICQSLSLFVYFARKQDENPLFLLMDL